jgi:isopentenyldiphosphate isomerase
MEIEIKVENTKEEIVVVVNEQDEVIGESTRKEMRKNNLIHRSTSIFIVNEE